jgi:hypothetical protein
MADEEDEVMAVSGRTQQGMYGSHADLTEYPGSKAEADARVEELRATGEYRRVEARRWNNGTRAKPLDAYKVMAWKK